MSYLIDSAEIPVDVNLDSSVWTALRIDGEGFARERGDRVAAGVTPPLDEDVYERFVEHDVRLEDLRDPGFDKEALRHMGIVRVGVQLRILRAVDRAFPSRQQGRGGGHGAIADPYRSAAPASESAAAARREKKGERVWAGGTRETSSAAMISPTRSKRKKKTSPQHGVALEALESMQATLVPHLLCVLTPSSRPLWAKYPGRLGREILSRIKAALGAAPVGIPNFEVPVIMNMLLWESTRTSFDSLVCKEVARPFGEQENASTPAEEGLEECIDTDTLVRCVLPRAGDSTFEWFRSAPDDAIEALVLPFDMDLVAAYEERPSDLVKCLVDAVQVRVQEHVSL